MSENIIEAKHLTKVYSDGNVLAVDDVSFAIKKGEIFALLGPNGAGKTTTISILATLLNPTKGRAKVNSFDIEVAPDKVRKSIGIVFQESSVDLEMKGRENLELHGILYGMHKKERREKIKNVLKLVDLEDKAELYVKNYSGGMKRRLEIARGLIHEPTVLFLDEPTLGLDPQTRRKIWEKIKELNKGDLNMTILITTHYMEEADELADRICIMDHGKIIALDSSEKLKKQLSGDIVEIELENSAEIVKIPELVATLQKIPGVNNITLGKRTELSKDIALQTMAGMPKNMNPTIIRSKIREMMANPKKMIKAWNNHPMAKDMFLNAPFEMKQKIANLFDDGIVEGFPEPIKSEIIRIKRGEVDEDSKIDGQIMSISCENGGKQLSLIIQKINDFNLEIKKANMHQPTLEDVFLFHTGKAIREESGDRVKNIKDMIQRRHFRR